MLEIKKENGITSISRDSMNQVVVALQTASVEDFNSLGREHTPVHLDFALVPGHNSPLVLAVVKAFLAPGRLTAYFGCLNPGNENDRHVFDEVKNEPYPLDERLRLQCELTPHNARFTRRFSRVSNHLFYLWDDAEKLLNGISAPHLDYEKAKMDVQAAINRNAISFSADYFEKSI